MDTKETNTAMVKAENEVAVYTQPMQSIESLKSWYNQFVEFSRDIMKDGLDYGVIPGVSKKVLLKAGAEKLRFAYGLTTNTEMVRESLEFDKGYIDYTYKTTVSNAQGRVLAQCDGNAHSFEVKFHYLWVKEEEVPRGLDIDLLKQRTSSISEFTWAIDKAETQGKYGKPKEYWDKFKAAIEEGRAVKVMRKTSKGESPAWEISATLYRIPNPDIWGLKNTIMKMAQKRSFVGAIMLATGASEFFTQDLEDMEIPVAHDIEAEFTVVKEEKEDKPKEEKSTGIKTVADELENLGMDFVESVQGEEDDTLSKQQADRFMIKYAELWKKMRPAKQKAFLAKFGENFSPASVHTATKATEVIKFLEGKS